jgi:hypothetical protein
MRERLLAYEARQGAAGRQKGCVFRKKRAPELLFSARISERSKGRHIGVMAHRL